MTFWHNNRESVQNSKHLKNIVDYPIREVDRVRPNNKLTLPTPLHVSHQTL